MPDLSSYPYPEDRVKLYPPSGYVYCPRHRAWEPIVEDETLCDWCCAPRDWCQLHEEGWEDKQDEEEEVVKTEPRRPRLREEDELDDEAIIVDMTET